MRLGLFSLVILIVFSNPVWSQNLYTYSHGASSRLVSHELAKDSSQFSKIWVFSKHTDFLNNLGFRKDAVLLAPYLSMPDSHKSSVFLTSQKPHLEYFTIILNDKTNTAKPRKSLRLGGFNFMGKKATKQFIRDSLNLQFRSVKLAHNIDDLQSLLGLGIVDALLLNETQLKELKAQSKLNLIPIWSSERRFNFAYCMATKDTFTKDRLRKSISRSSIPSLGISEWRVTQ